MNPAAAVILLALAAIAGAATGVWLALVEYRRRCHVRAHVAEQLRARRR